MSPPNRSQPRIAVAALLLAALLSLTFAACGSEEPELDVPEGEPLELGEMEFDVQISRFLNPSSPEDSQYLVGAPPLEPGQQYFGVFMEIANEGEEPNVVPYPFKIIDTRGNIFYQDEVENPFALIPGTPILGGDRVPGPETAAANGPIEGLLVLFSLAETASEDRPLKFVVPGPSEVGEIELDL